MDLQQVRKTVAKIKAKLFKKSNSAAAGVFKSKFRGTGLQFREHRVYEAGDEVRFIDWKMLAKTSSPYIKTFEEERNVVVVVVIDAGPSMFLGHYETSKLEAAIQICSLLYLLAAESKDQVQAVLLTDRFVTLPLAAGERGISLLVSILSREGLLLPGGQINRFRAQEILGNKGVAGNRAEVEKILLKNLARKRELVYLSDFQDALSDEVLRRLSYKKHAHFFCLETPFDRASKIPFSFSFKTISSSGETRNLNGQIYSKGKGAAPNRPYRVKELDISEHFLEQFVEEMR